MHRWRGLPNTHAAPTLCTDLPWVSDTPPPTTPGLCSLTTLHSSCKPESPPHRSQQSDGPGVVPSHVLGHKSVIRVQGGISISRTSPWAALHRKRTYASEACFLFRCSRIVCCVVKCSAKAALCTGRSCRVWDTTTNSERVRSPCMSLGCTVRTRSAVDVRRAAANCAVNTTDVSIKCRDCQRGDSRRFGTFLT